MNKNDILAKISFPLRKKLKSGMIVGMLFNSERVVMAKKDKTVVGKTPSGENENL